MSADCFGLVSNITLTILNANIQVYSKMIQTDRQTDRHCTMADVIVAVVMLGNYTGSFIMYCRNKKFIIGKP